MSRSIILCVMLLCLCGVTTATDVSGPVFGTWTLSGSPYNVFGEINIPANLTLIIQPGVQVIFQGHYKFKVLENATLRAVGTQQDSILFTAANPATGWYGIRFHDASDSSKLQFCHLEYGLANGPPDPEYSNAGGAILCAYSSPTIQNCLIYNCRANLFGGGIFCVQSSPIITNCIISNNHVRQSAVANYGGGICCFNTSNAVILSNLILFNSSGRGGGICCLDHSNPIIKNNIIASNSADYWGGAIHLAASSVPEINNNTLINNSAQSGGAVHVYDSVSIIRNSIIWANSGQQIVGSPQIQYSDIQGGYSGTGNINSDPLFANGPGGNYFLSQISAGQIQQSPCVDAGDPSSPMIDGTTRTDGVQDQGIVDMGYHYTPPLPPTPAAPSNLVATLTLPAQINLTWLDNSNNEDNFRLEKNYDSTGYVFVVNIPANQTQYTENGLPPGLYQYRLRAENQYGNSDWAESNRITISPPPPTMDINIWPVNPPVVIPANGGWFFYNINARNYGDSTQTFNVWNRLRLPNGTITDPPVWGPITRTLGAGANPTRQLQQTIAGTYPPGNYLYISYVGTYPSVISDSSLFEFSKSAIADHNPWISESKCEGDFLDEYGDAGVGAHGMRPSGSMQVMPNPFNPSTVLSFELRVSSLVSLKVYDTAGRLVQTLVDGWREAGSHQIPFEGSGLSSGIYIYRLQAGEFTASGKMALLK